MDILFEKRLAKLKPNGDTQYWGIRVESPGHSRGAFIVTEQQPRANAPVATRKKAILKGKRMRSSRPQLPEDLAVTEATSRVLDKLDKGFEQVA